MKLERVVVGVDFSDDSIAALAWTGRHLAPDAKLVIVHAVDVPEPPPFLRGRFPPTAELIELARRGAGDRVRALTGSLGLRDLRAEIRVGRGWETIESVAVDADADLIVIGKHGARSGLWRGLGGTAERLSRCTSMPILLATETRDAKPARLLAAVDDDDVSEWVLGWARGLAVRLGASLTLINVVSTAVLTHVMTLSSIAASGGEVNEQVIEREFRDDAGRWLRRLAAAGSGVEGARFVTAAGNPAEEILAAADRLDSDLIIVGSRQPGRVRRALLGSTAAEILHRARRPVLVVKEPAKGSRRAVRQGQ
jgi:nucleotide-binding universal stress UspA family protein